MSATQVQFRRGTDAQNNSFTGADGEITIDTTNHQIRVHDGSTPGGFAAPAVTPTGNLTVTGNITAAYFVGNGAALTGLPAGYANSDAVAYAESGWAGNIIPSANITYDLGNATNRWNDIWLANSTIHLGEVSISATGANLQLPATVQIGNVTLSESDGNLALPENIAANTVAATGNVTGGNIADSKGEIRLVPINSKDTTYTLLVTDHGKFISTNSGVTVPNGVFGAGQSVTVYNNSSSSITITQGASVTMYQVGTATTGNRTLAQRGLATIFCVDANTFVITGGGVS